MYISLYTLKHKEKIRETIKLQGREALPLFPSIENRWGSRWVLIIKQTRFTERSELSNRFKEMRVITSNSLPSPFILYIKNISIIHKLYTNFICINVILLMSP